MNLWNTPETIRVLDLFFGLLGDGRMMQNGPDFCRSRNLAGVGSYAVNERIKWIHPTIKGIQAKCAYHGQLFKYLGDTSKRNQSMSQHKLRPID